MLRRVFLPAALFVAALSLQRAVQADDLKVVLPADAKFVVRLDVAAIRQSEVGGPLFERVKGDVLGKMAKDNGGPSAGEIEQVLGFDPFEEVQAIVVAASEYDSPEKSLVACIQLGQTTGNLEGLMLALPHYQVDSYGDHQIHSARPEDDVTVYGAPTATGRWWWRPSATP
jgi:hypothetical protein